MCQRADVAEGNIRVRLFLKFAYFGIMNDDPGATLNRYPWIAAIKEKAFNVDGKSSKTSSTATQHVTNFLHF